MSLQDDIVAAQTSAMKERRAEDLAMLRLLTTAIKNEQIAKGDALVDADVQAVVKRQMKQLKDALSDFQKAGRDDLVAQSEKEIALIATFLPAELSDDALREIVDQTVATLSDEEKANIGRVMGAVMKAVAGRADGNRVRELVNATLHS